MKPRVLPRALAAVVAVAFFSVLGAEARAQTRRHPGPSPSPTADTGTVGEHLRRLAHGDDDQDSEGGSESVSLSDEIYVPKGQVHKDDVVCIFGTARIEGEVTGNVVVVMGRLEVSGTVRGDVVAVLSPSNINEGAVIMGDLVTIGGPLERAPESRVWGQDVKLNFLQFLPFIRGGWSGLVKLWFLYKLVKLLGLFLMLLLVTALVPRRLSTIAEAFPTRWGMSIVAGLIAYCATIVLCVIVACTIIGIPLAIAMWLVAKVIKWIGLAAILFLMGQTLGRNVMKRDLSHFAAVLGGFAVYSVIALVPIFGGIFCMGMSVLALGISILTRFGSEEPWRKSGATPPPIAPPAPPLGAPPPAAPPDPAVAPGAQG